ncbi:MAG: hypothetical protein ABEL51_14400 [Salinibacter sp.]
MTDRDRDLQDAFDRHLHGEGPPPDTEDDPEAAAYEAVYANLSEEPDGTDLPDDFAEQVADRAGFASESGMVWIEIFLLFLLIAGAGAGLVLMPPTLAGIQQSVGDLLMSLQDVSGTVRLDVILAGTLVLMLTIGFDFLINRLHPGHHTLTL